MRGGARVGEILSKKLAELAGYNSNLITNKLARVRWDAKSAKNE